jgi:translation initiation factor 3 subunit A
MIASSVVLAALAVAPYDHTQGASHLELENEKERNMRMANLIGFNLDLKPESREVVMQFIHLHLLS